jgi:excisionase family DNA binding protein
MKRDFEATAIAEPPMETPGILLDVREVGQLLSFGRTKILAMVAAREMPAPVKIGRSSRWRRADLDAWVATGCRPLSKSVRR